MRRLTQEENIRIAQWYTEGVPVSTISEILGARKVAIYDALKRRGVSRRNKSEAARRYPVNNGFFDTVTEESAYTVGFLAADGCVSIRKDGREKTISVCLGNRDLNHLVKLASVLQPGKPVYRSDRYHQSTLSVASGDFVDRLIAYGVTPRKSHTLSISDELSHNRHFWRGMIDGDGCIRIVKSNHVTLLGEKRTYTSPAIVLYGSKRICEQFREFVSRVAPGNNTTVCSVSSIYSIQINGKYAISIMKELYNNSTLYLDRKKVLADNLIWTYEGKYLSKNMI